ncbi:hypothetical protein G6L80_16160 [Agrobacterium rhizogenes]|nr:hypothetical protein [Rhizobium rhizogenes]NTF43460.1 hypothetical protein [Rhizobium rhizogenes]
MSYRVTNIEGAVKTADWTTGTIQQFGFIQDGPVEVIGKYDQGQAERDDRQYDPENDAADRFNYAECASQSADASRGYSDFGQFIHLSKYQRVLGSDSINAMKNAIPEWCIPLSEIA